MSRTAPADCWVLHDGAAGNRRQATALASALGLTWRDWTLRANGPARWFAPRKWPGTSFGEEFTQALRTAPPSLAIGCGRVAALATRLARESGARTVQVLDPRLSPRHWDLVVVPEHDRLRGDNVITLLGSLNPVGGAWLAEARTRFPAFGTHAAPRIGVLLGGPTDAVRIDEGDLANACDVLDNWRRREGGSLMVCVSRRTPTSWAALIRARFTSPENLVWIDEGDGPNPYAGVLAWSDRLVVTADSVNMVSEACTTELPVQVIGTDRARGRIASFLASLQARGRTSAPDSMPATAPVTALAETARVAAQVRAYLGSLKPR